MARKIELNPAKKAAVILLSLPKEEAAGILKVMSPKCMELITSEIRSLRDITDDMRQEAVVDFSLRLQSNKAHGGEEMARALLEEVVGAEKANELMEKARQDEANSQAFKFLEKMNSADLASLLSNEQAATIAIILGFLDPKKVAEVIEYIDEDIRDEIVMRLATPTSANREVVDRIEQVFIKRVAARMKTKKSDAATKLGGPRMVADILQQLDRSMGEKIIGTIAEESDDLADEISQLLFTFDDIISFTDTDIQRILRDIPMEKLPLALRGVGSELVDKITNNLSKRAKENLFEEMELMGKVKLSEVEANQKEIVTIIRALDAAGEISLSVGSGEEDVYV